jgi:hypothetical protein
MVYIRCDNLFLETAAVLIGLMLCFTAAHYRRHVNQLVLRLLTLTTTFQPSNNGCSISRHSISAPTTAKKTRENSEIISDQFRRDEADIMPFYRNCGDLMQLTT